MRGWSGAACWPSWARAENHDPSALSPPRALKAEGGFGQAGLGVYAQWVHSQAFVQVVVRPASIEKVHADPFHRWASGKGLVLDPLFLPYLQLAPIPLSKPTFLQGSLKCYSVVRRGGGG